VKFGITIRVDGRTIRLQVERIYLSGQIERFEVKARNKTLTIQSNRPLLRGKGIKHRKPDYKLIAGDIKSSGALEKIIEAVHSYLRNDERA
jgi:hypothetical protein